MCGAASWAPVPGFSEGSREECLRCVSARFCLWYSGGVAEAPPPPASETDGASGDQKWVQIVIWMSGLSFDEVFKVPLRPDWSFSNVIFLQSNCIMNNLWLAHKPSSRIWTLSVSAFVCL